MMVKGAQVRGTRSERGGGRELESQNVGSVLLQAVQLRARCSVRKG